MQISYLPYSEIDKDKWDHCMSLAGNRLIYGFSFYLDNIADNWDGLILDDYKAVMPLTWRQKLLIKYLYQPAFMQQSGIFSSDHVDEEMTKAFLEKAAGYFKFAEISMNYANQVNKLDGNLQRMRINYVLPLETYEASFNNYSPNFTKSLRRIKKFDLRYETSEDFASIVAHYQTMYENRLPSFNADDFKNITVVCTHLEKKHLLISRRCFSTENKLLAGIILLQDANRLYNLISFVTAEGKKLEANYFLFDKVIQEFNGRGFLLDLEGSEVPGIAAFYKKLNPVPQPFPMIKYNELNPLLKVFKK